MSNEQLAVPEVLQFASHSAEHSGKLVFMTSLELRTILLATSGKYVVTIIRPSI